MGDGRLETGDGKRDGVMGRIEKPDLSGRGNRYYSKFNFKARISDFRFPFSVLRFPFSDFRSPISVYIIISLLGFLTVASASEDPWSQLRERVKEQYHEKQDTVSRALELPDPWKQLQAVFLPFSAEDEENAVTDPQKSKAFAKKINQRLASFDGFITHASQVFKVPKELISAVIMAESGGNPAAGTRLSSAKGLMQTIDSTFKMAKKALIKKGIPIKDNPFDPESSIMAGTWYLNQMYEHAVIDGKIGLPDKKSIASWRYPLEYYYAGPGNGAKTENRIYVFSNGTRRLIDKRAYSQKIQQWAGLIGERRTENGNRKSEKGNFPSPFSDNNYCLKKKPCLVN